MKIAALALAPAFAAVVGSAQPSFAQSSSPNDQYSHDQYNDDLDQAAQSGVKARNQNEDDESSTTGQSSYGDHYREQFRSSSNDDANNDNWRNNRMRSGSKWENDTDGGWGHHRMEGRMGQMGQHPMMMGMMRSQGARFSFNNGNAHVNVQCPSNESLQDCVQAAGQLLDKISRLRNNSPGSSTSSGSSTSPNTTVPGVGVAPQTTSPTGQ